MAKVTSRNDPEPASGISRSEERQAETGNRSSPFAPDALRKQLLRPRTILSFLIAIVILVLFVRRSDLDLGEVWTIVKQASMIPLAGAFVAYFSSLLVRAYRWGWMLRLNRVGETPGTRLPSTPHLAGVYAVSWSINCVIPAKLGDGYRAYRIQRDDGVGYGIGFGTIVSERMADLMVLVPLMIATGLVAFRGSLPEEANRVAIFGLALLTIATISLAALWTAGRNFTSRMPERLRGHYTTFRDALFVILKRPVVPILLAVAIWLMEGARVYLVSVSVDAGISFEMAVFVALMSAMLTTVPFTPAGLGVVEVAIIAALELADVPVDLAGSVAVLDRFITYWCVILVGLATYVYMSRRGHHVSMDVQPDTEPSSSLS